MPMSTSPASTARSTFSVLGSSTNSTSPRLLSRAYSSAASSENDPRMPMTPSVTRSPTAGHLLVEGGGEAGQLRGQLGRPLQGDVVHGVLEPGDGGGWEQLEGAGDRAPRGAGIGRVAGRAQQHRAVDQRVQVGRPMVIQGLDDLQVVLEPEPGPGHPAVVDLDPVAQVVADPGPAAWPAAGLEPPGPGQPVGQ